MTTAPAPTATPAKARIVAVDVTRGVALLGMLAANVFDPLNSDGTPSIAVMTVIGRSATLFAFVAGLTLALTTGGRHPVQGPARNAAAAGLAVRALLIATIGLALGNVDASGNVDVILAYYGMFFLLAIPLIGLKPRSLACIAGALVVVAPLAELVTFRLGMHPAFSSDSTLSAPFTNPMGLVLQLFVTGDYPAVVYLIYICAGLAIGRLDLSSTKVAVRLLVGGAALAAAAWEASWVLLFPLAAYTTCRPQPFWHAGPDDEPNCLGPPSGRVMVVAGASCPSHGHAVRRYAHPGSGDGRPRRCDPRDQAPYHATPAVASRDRRQHDLDHLCRPHGGLEYASAERQPPRPVRGARCRRADLRGHLAPSGHDSGTAGTDGRDKLGSRALRGDESANPGAQGGIRNLGVKATGAFASQPGRRPHSPRHVARTRPARLPSTSSTLPGPGFETGRNRGTGQAATSSG